jgi:hypothetical protein
MHLDPVKLRFLDIREPINRRKLLHRDLLAKIQHRSKGVVVVLGMKLTLTKGFGLKPVIQKEIERKTMRHIEAPKSRRERPKRERSSSGAASHWKTVMRHGWRMRAYREVFTACFPV